MFKRINCTICNQNEMKWIKSIYKCSRGYSSYIVKNLYFYIFIFLSPTR